jgi:outer membrane protein assembly factor BamB
VNKRSSWLAAVALSTLTGSVWLPQAAVSQLVNRGHAPDYSQTTWATVHADSSNSDYVPLVTSLEVEQKWRVLTGAALWTAPSVSPEGNIHIASGRGPGTSHLHVFDPSGNLLWESKPQSGLDDLDSTVVMNAPLIDGDGDIYVGDINQFWAFHPDGKVKWTTDVAGHGIAAPFITAIISGGYVGGISADGKVIMLRRDTGVLAMPVLDLPGSGSPLGPPIPEGLWGGGLVDPQIRDMVWEILRGQRYEITNTPAVHPDTGRIYIVGAGVTEQKGSFYGIDIVDNELVIAFQTAVPPRSGTSPAISADGHKVYAMASGHLFAIDANRGSKLWTVDVNGQAASPAVAPDNTVYVLGGNKLVAVDGNRGTIKWRADYSELAEARLPRVWSRFGLIPTGKPDAFVDSVVTITPEKLWTSLLLGYELNLFGRHFTHAVKTILVAVSPKDGRVLKAYPLPDSSEGGISVSQHGDLYLDILAAGSSISYYSGYQWLLPSALKVGEPKAGLVAFTPVSQQRQAIAGIDWALHLLQTHSEREGKRHLESARRQLDASLSSLQLAQERDEISASQFRAAAAVLQGSAEKTGRCSAETRTDAAEAATSCSDLSGLFAELSRAKTLLTAD